MGSDIAMVLDECIETPAPREKAEAALIRTTRWAKQARQHFLANENLYPGVRQWQFGIVQGATFADLRRESARQLLDLDFPGYAVGGLAVGEPHSMTCEMTGEVTALLPADRPRYLMGVGKPEQLADYVALRYRYDGLRVTHAGGAARLFVYQRRPRADQKCALRQRTPGRSIRSAAAAFVNVTRARICATFLRLEKSPRRSWQPTTISTFTLTSCGKSERLSSSGTSQNSQQRCRPAMWLVRPEW